MGDESTIEGAVALKSDPSRVHGSDRMLVRAIWIVGVVLAVAVLALGVAYYRERYYHPTVGVVDREIANIEEQIRREPENASLRISTAYLYIDKGRYDDAIAQAQAVLNLSNDDFAALQAMGMAYAGKKDRAQAITYFQRAVELNKDNPMAKVSRQLAAIRFYLGKAYFEENRLDEAIPELRAAAESDSTNADAKQLLGEALLAKGDVAGALDSFQRAVRLVPDFAEAYTGMGKAYEVAGDPIGVAYTRAMVSYSRGAPNEAITQLQQIAAQWVDRADLHLGLALAYEHDGQSEQALVEYREALRLAPDSFAAQRGVARLGTSR